MLRSLHTITMGLAIIALLATGCTQPQTGEQEEEEPALKYERAVAVIHPTEGNDLSGTVIFEKTADGTLIDAEVNGLETGKHGFHIHQYGNCTAPDGTSAGGHFNPEGVDHGAPTDEIRHVGDMGNLPANEEGTATLEYTDPLIKLNGPNSVIGRGIIIHSGQDDLTSQPTGAAGARLGCGVIGVDSKQGMGIPQEGS